MELEEFFRDTWQTSLVFATLLIWARVLGKTQVGQLTFYDYVSGITIGSVAANIIASDPDKVWNHFYDLLLFCALTYLVAWLTLSFRPLRKIIEGSPTVVVENGKILAENMRGMRYDMDELTGQLRESGIFDLSEVEYALLETTGKLSVIKKAANKPITRQDLSIQHSEARLPIEMIMDGEILEENLPRAGVSREWLIGELNSRGIAELKDVMYATFDSKGKFYVAPRKETGQQT